MALKDYADKIVGLAGFGIWGAMASGEGTALALAEPVAGALVLGTSLITQFNASNNDICAKAIDTIRRQTETAMTKAVADNQEYSAAITQAFADFSAFSADVYPTNADLVGLWQLDPHAIANGLMDRLREKSAVIRDNHLAAQVVARVMADAVTAFQDDPALNVKLQPALARAYLSYFGAVHSGVAAVKTVVDDTAAMLRQLLEMAKTSGQTEQVAAAGIDPSVIITQARRIAADIEDVDQALKELENAVTIALKVQRDGAGGSNAGAFVDAVLKEVAALSGKNQYSAASDVASQAFEQWERDELTRQRDEIERQQAALIAGFKLLEAGWQQDLLDGNTKAAAAKIARGAMLNLKDQAARFAALRAVQDEWYARGRDKGLNLDLAVAIELARLSVDAASSASQKGDAHNLLGISLKELGRRLTGVELLESAVKNYETALTEHRLAGSVIDEAAVQSNLGNVLVVLSERSSVLERLHRAVIAFRAALALLSREQNPHLWATIHTNLGNALSGIGRSSGQKEPYDEAVVVLTAALQVFNRIDFPQDWAMTQAYLGGALHGLGEGFSNEKLIRQAILAYEAALLEYPRDRFPLMWAETKNSLGLAFLGIGKQFRRVDDLKKAVLAFQDVLEEQTFDRVPLSWAICNCTLGLAHDALFDWTREISALELALSLFDKALKVFDAARESRYLDMARNERLRIFHKLNGIEAGRAG